MGSTPMFVNANELFPLELLAKIFLELYEAPSDHDLKHGKVLHRTLAACRLVCRRWSKIVKPTSGRFIIRAYDKGCPSFSDYML